MHLNLSSSSDSSSDSLENCSAMSSNDATIVSSRVPFKWEEAAGKPITATMSPCNEMISYNQIALQLPPKLQFQGHQSPLFLQQSLYESPSSSPLSLLHRSPSRVSPNHQKLKRLYKYMLKTASWSQPLHTQSWSRSACAISDAKQDKLAAVNERFFFDKPNPKEFKYSVSMDSWKPQLPIHEEYKQHDVFVSGEALSFLAMEEHEAKSTASSPWHPIMFHERGGSESPCQPIKASEELGGDDEENDEGSPCQPTPIKASKELGGDDEEDDEGFHDFCSTAASSLEKPSQRTDESMEPSYPSPSPWLLDFGPEEEEVHEEKGRSKLVVKLVALVKLKNIISSKVCKLRGRREGANQQANYTSMWSPTLATYLYNQQKEERESSSPSLDYLASEDDDDDDDDAELPSSSSVASSHRFQINPDYHLPSSILRGHLHPHDDFLEGEGSSSFRVHQLGLDGSPCFSEEEEEEPHKLRHRLSLREQLSEFDDECPFQLLPSTPQILDSKRREPTPCRGMCKVRRTVKVLAATIKLILVQTDVGKRNGQQRPSLKYGSCIKPTINTLSPFPSTHK